MRGDEADVTRKRLRRVRDSWRDSGDEKIPVPSKYQHLRFTELSKMILKFV